MASARIWKSGERKVGTLLLVTTLAITAGLASCNDDGTTGPEEIGDDATNLFPGLTVSDPTGPPSGEGAPAAWGALAAASPGLTYVSASPYTFANVNSVTITNLANGKSLTVSAQSGGFDPTALEAEPGDTLEIQVHHLSTSTSTYFTSVPVRKRPRVVRTVPPKGATEVVLMTIVVVVFSEPTDATTVTVESLRLRDGEQPVDGTLELSDDGLTVEFTPEEPLELETVYTLVITTDVLDLQGDPLDEEIQVTFSTGNQIVSVSAGNYHTCATAVDGGVFCWGHNYKGRCGLPESEVEPPRRVTTTQRFASMALGHVHTCGVTFEGDTHCWGWNFWGQLGRGGTSDSHFPVLTLGGHSFVSLTAGSQHTCGVTNDGTAYCWGRADFLQIGPGRYELCTHGSSTYPCHKTPLLVGDNFELLTAGHIFTCGLKSDGLAFCWGANHGGNLGIVYSLRTETCLNGAPCTRHPIAVRGGHSFVDLNGSVGHICGVTADGTAFCWGRNGSGQLGAGFIAESTNEDPEPLAVVGGLTFATVVTGDEHTCGLTGDGQAFCWGSNDYGQLGNGGEISQLIAEPVEVSGSLHFSMLTSGFYHTCGLTVDREVYCWGDNLGGQLGHDPTAFLASNIPRRVPGLP
jgi:alpha-tubulin suppressor-like RCC1 family protein